MDGPQVTVDHYASPNGCGGDCDLVNTPVLTFSQRETFGYSLNGEEFLVAQGESYTTIADKSPYSLTVAKILAGNNESTAKDYAARPFTKPLTPAGATASAVWPVTSLPWHGPRIGE